VLVRTCESGPPGARAGGQGQNGPRGSLARSYGGGVRPGRGGWLIRRPRAGPGSRARGRRRWPARRSSELPSRKIPRDRASRGTRVACRGAGPRSLRNDRTRGVRMVVVEHTSPARGLRITSFCSPPPRRADQRCSAEVLVGQRVVVLQTSTPSEGRAACHDVVLETSALGVARRRGTGSR